MGVQSEEPAQLLSCCDVIAFVNIVSTLQSSRQLGFSTGGDQEAGGDTRERESESDDDDGQPDAASIARQVRVRTLSALCDRWTFRNTLRISCFTSVGMLSDSCACLTLQGCARQENGLSPRVNGRGRVFSVAEILVVLYLDFASSLSCRTRSPRVARPCDPFARCSTTSSSGSSMEHPRPAGLRPRVRESMENGIPRSRDPNQSMGQGSDSPSKSGIQ